jgi:ElaB/YqjD/DUF883 family membrane-anchored ribosome-binding protein
MKTIDSPITFGNNSLSRPDHPYSAPIAKPDESIGDKVSENLGQLKDGAVHAAGVAADGMKEGYEGAKSYARDTLHSLEREVSAKPLQSMAIAFTAGAFLSMMMGRR